MTLRIKLVRAFAIGWTTIAVILIALGFVGIVKGRAGSSVRDLQSVQPLEHGRDVIVLAPGMYAFQAATRLRERSPITEVEQRDALQVGFHMLAHYGDLSLSDAERIAEILALDAEFQRAVPRFAEPAA